MSNVQHWYGPTWDLDGEGEDRLARDRSDATTFHQGLALPACEATFEHLAAYDPPALFAMVTSGNLGPGMLTHALEWVGRSGPSEQALEILSQSLGHPSPLVREGAIYGLQALGPSDEIVRLLVRRTWEQVEASPGVREAAAEALEHLRR